MDESVEWLRAWRRRLVDSDEKDRPKVASRLQRRAGPFQAVEMLGFAESILRHKRLLEARGRKLGNKTESLANLLVQCAKD